MRILYFIPLFTCLAISAVLAVKGKPGWGWFLVAALLLTPSESK